MNDPEVTMLDAIDNRSLVAHRIALEATGAAIKLVMRLPGPLKPIADQIVRSASSMPANLRRVRFAEGVPGTVENGSRIPCASFAAVPGTLSDAPEARGPATCGSSPQPEPSAPPATQSVLAALGHVRAMTWRLLNPQA